MVLVVGTNCGFVTEAPSADPSGDSNDGIDNNTFAAKHTSPATAIKVTEIGWWCDNATPAANYQVGIYTDDGSTIMPENLLSGASLTNAKGTGIGWKKVTGLDITISPETLYWIAVSCANTTPTTDTDRSVVASQRYEEDPSEHELLNPWGATSGDRIFLVAIYAVWEVGPPTAAFSGTPLNGAKPLTVQFTDSSTFTPTSWLWNFGDGETSTTQSPSHDYAREGIYTVTLVATNAGGSDTETKTEYVLVHQVFRGTEGTKGTKDIATNYPHVSGIEADEKHEGRQINLVPEEESLVPESKKVLL